MVLSAPCINDEIVERIADEARGYTGADLEDVVRRAGMLALRENLTIPNVPMRLFEQALRYEDAARLVAIAGPDLDGMGQARRDRALPPAARGREQPCGGDRCGPVRLRGGGTGSHWRVTPTRKSGRSRMPPLRTPSAIETGWSTR